MRKMLNWRHIPLFFVLLFVAGPLYLLFSNALKSESDFQTNPLGNPQNLEWGNFAEAWQRGAYGSAFTNSALVAVVCIAIIVIASGLAAYALAFLRFNGSRVIMGLLLFVMSVPMGLFVVPLFFLWKQLDLMDSLLGIILIYSAIFLPFNMKSESNLVKK